MLPTPANPVVLISPYPDSGLTDMREPPLGLAYIAAVIRTKEYPVVAIDAKQLMLRTDTVATMSVASNPVMVGITAMTPDIIWAGKIARKIKEQLPQLKIVIGGPHATALPQRTLQEFPAFDIAVIGEGEYAMIELLEAIAKNSQNPNLEEITGISFRKDGEIIMTRNRPFLENLDILPFPAWDLFPRPTNNAYPVYATRGCPFKCNFCQRVLGSRLRRRSVNNVIAEIEWLINSIGISGFWFADETFGVGLHWTKELLSLLKNKVDCRTIHWHAQTRIEIMNSELLQEMKQAGCKGIAFGIESGNEEILRKSGKNIDLKQVQQAVTSARKIKLKTRSFFILGHPDETVETIKDTIRYAANINTDYVSFAVMVPYPGTEIWDLAHNKKGGYTYVSENWDDFRKHLAAPLGFSNLSAAELREWDKKAYIHFYVHNHRWIDFAKFLWEHRFSIKASILNAVPLIRRKTR